MEMAYTLLELSGPLDGLSMERKRLGETENDLYF